MTNYRCDYGARQRNVGVGSVLLLWEARWFLNTFRARAAKEKGPLYSERILKDHYTIKGRIKSCGTAVDSPMGHRASRASNNWFRRQHAHLRHGMICTLNASTTDFEHHLIITSNLRIRNFAPALCLALPCQAFYDFPVIISIILKSEEPPNRSNGAAR